VEDHSNTSHSFFNAASIAFLGMVKKTLSLFVCRPSVNILIFSSETTGPIATKLWWNDPWMAPGLV
jgi:hypothetical protein